MNTLYLIPSTIGDVEISQILPAYLTNIIDSVYCYIVENERSARRFLLKAGLKNSIDELTFFVLDKHTNREGIEKFLEPADHEDIGLLSEAGVPCIADPGAEIVKLAHKKGLRVVPLVGPSSILMAMMASGLNGQNFAFTGYLPVKSHELTSRIKQLESRSQQENQSQIFIEAPYRNNQLIKTLLQTCHPETLLCIAADISTKTEFIHTKPVKDWKKEIPDLHKRPAIFILHRQ